ncbi:Retaining alpha-galactosidase, partial [termite gut metagenome]
MAYRFVNQRKKPFTIQSEEVVYNFGKDVTATVPYVNVGKDGDYKSQFMNSFENTYVTGELSQLNKGKLMFLPLLINSVGEKKVCITEVDLENY